MDVYGNVVINAIAVKRCVTRVTGNTRAKEEIDFSNRVSVAGQLLLSMGIKPNRLMI